MFWSKFLMEQLLGAIALVTRTTVSRPCHPDVFVHMTFVLHQPNDTVFILIAVPICLTIQTSTVLLLARPVRQTFHVQGMSANMMTYIMIILSAMQRGDNVVQS
jgi:hypothetical protein